MEISQFAPQREKAEQYAEAINDLLGPINAGLKGLSAEVKPIELQYSFDTKACKEAMIQNVLDGVGPVEGRAPRPDFVESKLKDIDFAALNNLEKTLEKIPEDTTVYGKILRDFFSQGVNFDLLKLQAELCLLDVRNFGSIRVLYDRQARGKLFIWLSAVQQSLWSFSYWVICPLSLMNQKPIWTVP